MFLNKCTRSLKLLIQSYEHTLSIQFGVHTSAYLEAVLAEFNILNGSTASTHSFGLDFIRSQRATSAGVESIQSTRDP